MSLKKTLLVFATISLAACGGGGGSSSSDGGTTAGDLEFSGSNDPATATEDNAAELARAATEGTIQAANNTNLPIGVESSGSYIDSLIREDILEAISIDDVPVGASFSYQGSCGGTHSYSYPDDVTNNSYYEYVGVYDNYCEGYGGGSTTINGTYSVRVTLRNDYYPSRVTYNYDITSVSTYNGESYVYNYSVASDCLYGDNYQEISCTVSDNFTGNDGRSYRVENVSGDEYNLSATVYDEDYGYFDIDASYLGYECDNGNFSSGTITITDSSSNEVISVDFPNCNDCVVTYGGVSTTYPQIFE